MYNKWKYISAYRNPETEEMRIILRRRPNDFVVVKLFPDPDRFSVKFWGGVSLEATVQRWNTNEPFIPQPHHVSKARDLVAQL